MVKLPKAYLHRGNDRRLHWRHQPLRLDYARQQTGTLNHFFPIQGGTGKRKQSLMNNTPLLREVNEAAQHLSPLGLYLL